MIYQYFILPFLKENYYFFIFLLLGYNASNVLLPRCQISNCWELLSFSPAVLLTDIIFSATCQSQTYYRRVRDFSAAKPSESLFQTFNSDTISQPFFWREINYRGRVWIPSTPVRAAHLRCYQWILTPLIAPSTIHSHIVTLFLWM